MSISWLCIGLFLVLLPWGKVSLSLSLILFSYQLTNTYNRYGDITPSTRFELCVAIMGMTVGIFLYGWLTAVLTAFFLHEDPHDAMVNNKMSQLTHYLKKHEYPRDMKRQIVSYFHHFYANTSSFDDVQMLQQLPYTLYESAAHFLVEKLIKNFFVFTGIEKDIVALILKVLKPMTSNDEIVKRGQPADTMFLINKGTLCSSHHTHNHSYHH